MSLSHPDPQATRRERGRLCGRVVAIALCALLDAHLAQAQSDALWWAGELSATTGTEWSSGDYGEAGDDTEILYVPFSIGYRFDAFPLTDTPLDQVSFRVTLPYLEIDTPLAFFAESPTSDGSPQFENQSERGIGDVVASATYSWFSLDDRWPGLEFTGKIKVPTADEDRNLGTGAIDAFAQLDTFKSWGRFIGFATVGVRFPGDPPDGHLDNSGYASGGLSMQLLPRLSGGAYYSWFGASSSSRHDSHELIAFASWRVSEVLRVEPYGVWGVAGYVPDYAVGLSLRVRTSFGRQP